jgi:hypothetical protein
MIRWENQGGHICNHKPLTETAARGRNVFFIKIDPEVIAIEKMACIGTGTAANIQYSPHLGQVVVAKNGA